MEIFKAVQGYEEYYKVSNLGRVKSLPRHRKWGNVTYLTKERFLRQRIHDGYYRVNLCGAIGTVMKTVSVHNLVINSFCQKTEGMDFANHKDLNRLNNHADNLEWVNRYENACHGFIQKPNRVTRYTGVCRSDTTSERYNARVSVNSVRKNLGSFATQELAYEAVVKFHQENNIINRYI